MIFSKNTLKLLAEAGWHKNRRINLNETGKTLSSEGFTPSAKTMEFLRRFGNLRIKQKTGDFFHFDIVEAIENIDPDWVLENYSGRVDSNLCLIGEAFNGYMTLCMSPKGEVYAGFDETLVYVGISGEEAINTLCSGREMANVPELNTGLSDDLKNSIKNVSRVTSVKAQLKKLKKLSVQQNGIIQLVEENWRKYSQKKAENMVLIPKVSNSTERCLEQMIKSDVFLSLGGIVYFIGLHPKEGMKKSQIKDYIVEHSKKRGSYIPKRNIETKFIPETKFAFTAYFESVPNPELRADESFRA